MPCCSPPAACISKASSPKRLSAPYRSGRTETWCKSKCRGGHEVVIGGWSGSATNLRSLIVGVYRGDHLVHVGQVGTGFNARNAKDLLKQLKVNVRPTKARSPARTRRADSKDWTWVKPRARRRDRVCRVDRWWHDAPGCLQGAAPGQASQRGARGASGRPRDAELATPTRWGKTKRIIQDGRHRYGRYHIQPRQAAVAGREGRATGHQARSCHLSRKGWSVDDRASQGTAVLHHPRARWHQ